MNRKHGTFIALLIAAGSATGVYAVTKTTGVSASAGTVPDAEIAQREAQLDQWATELREASQRKPGALGRRSEQQAAPAAQTRVSYVSSAPTYSPTETAAETPVRKSREQRPQHEDVAAAAEERADAPSLPTVSTEPTLAPAPALSAPAVVALSAAAPVTHSTSSPTGEGDDLDDEVEEHEVEDEGDEREGDDD